MRNPEKNVRSAWWVPSGIFLFVLGVYVLSSPGRIDIIDGQIRYDVTENLLRYGRPFLTDPALGRERILGWDGSFYSKYGVAASFFSLPFVGIGHLTHDPRREFTRFLFSLTSCVFGALIGALLYMFLVELGISRKRALAWTMVSSFTTLLWPVSTSTFDNAQRAFFALLAVWLGFLSAKRKSSLLAVGGGLAAGILMLYRTYWIILMPALALVTLERPSPSTLPYNHRQPGNVQQSSSLWASALKVPSALFAELRSLFEPASDAAAARMRYRLFMEATAVGLAGSLAYNLLRFGSLFQTAERMAIEQSGTQIFGSPLTGLLTLLVSPGKSVFLYSPAIILSLLGFRRLWRRAPYLGFTLAATSVILLGALSSTSFPGGDWCWGPRYLEILLPLWALAFPLLPERKLIYPLAAAIVGLSLAVQLMALTIDHQRFFFKRNLSDFFWEQDPWVYFKQSAIFARPAEIASLKEGVPQTARKFSSSPYPDLVTYCIFGNPHKERAQAHLWMRSYQVFYLPRPWPLWMCHIEKQRRPVNITAWIMACLGMMLLGVISISQGLDPAKREEALENLLPPAAGNATGSK